MKTNYFGYPSNCNKCNGQVEWKGLQVTGAYYKEGNDKRLMLVGQDPTIRRNPNRVKIPLMLDDPNSQISRWISGILGNEFNQITIYATNLVKCSFNRPPAEQNDGGLKFLTPYFKECKSYLKEEIEKFKPNILIGLGESVHKLISEMCNHNIKDAKMKKDFNGIFRTFKIGESGFEFKYTPCLHIQTFRVAESYGNPVRDFKINIGNILKETT